MLNKKRLVIKIGSSLLANSERLTARWAFIQVLLQDVASLREQGYQVVLCSSGAVALGMNMLNEKPELAGLRDKQAAAACGMPILLNAYKQIGHEYDLDIAQVLVTLKDLENRRRFLNTKNTVERLMESKITPIVNENDSVTTEELRVGDNDRLAAKVAQMIEANHLIILTCIDGLYDRHPDEPDAKLVEKIEDVSGYLDVADGASALGSGGMLTKMQAASMAQNVGCTTIIGHGEAENPVSSLLKNQRKHTRCIAYKEPSSAWHAWMTDRLHMAGNVVITDDACNQIHHLPNGLTRQNIISAQGDFSKGDIIHIYNQNDEEIARGVANFTSEEIKTLLLNPDISCTQLLGYQTGGTIISRNNLVVLQERHLPWDSPEEDEDMIVNPHVEVEGA